VQIDTINVIERCHHHILYTRIPGYQRAHLHQGSNTGRMRSPICLPATCASTCAP
jgi:uncharacterized protein YcaQ